MDNVTEEMISQKTDSKGRTLGYRLVVSDSAVGEYNVEWFTKLFNAEVAVGTPLFEVDVFKLANGKRFGASHRSHYFLTLDQALEFGRADLARKFKKL